MEPDDLHLYDVTVGAHKTRMRLNNRDALAYGADAIVVNLPVEAVAVVEVKPEPKARLVTSNKMRGTAEPDAQHERKAH